MDDFDLRMLLLDLRMEMGPVAYLVFPLVYVVAKASNTVKWLLQNWRRLLQVSRSVLEVFKMAVLREGIWAVAFHGGQIELRKGKRAPRAIKTQFEKDGEARVPRFEVGPNGEDRLRWDKVPRKITIANVIHSGGKVLGTTNSRKLYNVTRQLLDTGEVLKLTPSQAAKLLGDRP